MRFTLILHITSRNRTLPINYQYPLHSWIYRVIQSADAEFSSFLHDEGYRLGNKTFKLFTFSPLSCKPFQIYKQEQRIALNGAEIKLQISFLIDRAAENFIKGLFAGQQFSLGDAISHVDFEVVRIEAMPRPFFQNTMRYRSISPIVISRNPDRRMEAGRTQPQYMHPNDEMYPDMFLRHLVQKSAVVDTAAVDTAMVAFSEPVQLLEAKDWQFRLLSEPRKKGIHIKQHSEQHTQVIGYQYDFEVTAPVEVHEMAYYAGFGEKNSLGFGCVEVK